MTANDFNALCGKYDILPDIALGDNNICNMLRTRASADDIETYIQTNL